MRRGVLCGCVTIAAVAATWPVAAQKAAEQPKGRVTVSGCVEPAQRTGSLAGTGVGTTASPNTAATEANSGEPLNVYVLTDATPLPGGPAPKAGWKEPRMRYALEGHEQRLAAESGHRIEVVGTLAAPRSSGRGGTQDGFASGDRRIVVESFKRVGSDCSGGRR